MVKNMVKNVSEQKESTLKMSRILYLILCLPISYSLKMLTLIAKLHLEPFVKTMNVKIFVDEELDVVVVNKDNNRKISIPFIHLRDKPRIKFNLSKLYDNNEEKEKLTWCVIIIRLIFVSYLIGMLTFSLIRYDKTKKVNI